MSPFVSQVVRFIRQHALFAPGDRVVVALSGGPDSVALLRALVDGAPVLDVTVAGAAHLHHGLRGADADADETFCRALAGDLGLPIHVEHEDVAARARRRRQSIEAAGHDARAAFYSRALTVLGGAVVATGHNADDLAESVILHVGRGAGLRGATGIRPKTAHVVRPLLGTRRAAILRDLAARGQAYRTDPSNADRRFARNRVRHDVLPALAAAVSPRVVEALGRLARLASDDEELLDSLASERLAAIVQPAGSGWTLELEAFAELPSALKRRVAEGALRLAGARSPSLAHVEALLSLAAGGGEGAKVALPRLSAVVCGRALLIERVAAAESGSQRRGRGLEGVTPPPEPSEVPMSRIPIPGVLLDERGRWELTSRISGPMDESDVRRIAAGRDVAVIDAGRVGALFVRSRRPGDRIRPVGMSGRRKVQDVLVDAGVPRRDRDDVPIVVDEAGTLVWVAGHVVSEDVRVSGATTGVLLLCFRRIPFQRPESAKSAPEPRKGDRPGVRGRSG